MNIWLVQYLCPQRHAIVASPYDRDVDDPTAVEAALLAEMTKAGLDPWCGLCGSRDLHFEHGKTTYTDWDEALDALAVLSLKNILSRLAIDARRGETN